MKPSIIAVILVLFVAGIGAGYFVLAGGRGAETSTDAAPPPAAEPAPAAAHGHFPEIPPGATVCATHRVPEVVCPFCNPQFVEDAGFCGGHDVPEGLCTRCHPILIAAFKAEGDWCDEHGLPESQCRICNPVTEG